MGHKERLSGLLGPQFESGWNPFSLIDNSLINQRTGELPSFEFTWEQVGKKRREIAKPDRRMRKLHARFKHLLMQGVEVMNPQDKSRLLTLPSSRACRVGDNPVKNALEHAESEYFYITDFKDAYKMIDKRALSALLVYIFRYSYYRHELGYHLYDLGRYLPTMEEIEQDPMFSTWESFVELAFGGSRGEGVVLGGNLSPLIFNMYCEVFLDDRLRGYLQKLADKTLPETAFVYTRYIDDLVFSRRLPIGSSTRKGLRRHIENAGFPISHKKSKVLIRSKGTIFVTKVGLTTPEPFDPEKDEVDTKKVMSVLTFPRNKRRRLEHLIKSFLNGWGARPEVIAGFAAEFIYHMKTVVRLTSKDKHLMDLCKEFEGAAAPQMKAIREEQRRKAESRSYRRSISLA